MPESKKEEQTCQSSHIKQRGEMQLGTQIFYLRAQYLFLSLIVALKRYTSDTPTLSPGSLSHTPGLQRDLLQLLPTHPTPVPTGQVSVSMHQQIVSTTLDTSNRK